MNKRIKVYTAGAIEAASDKGKGWRDELTPFLENLNMEVLDPCKFEPQQLKNLRPNKLPEFYTDLFGNKVKPKHWHELKNAKEPHLYARFKKYMERIIRFDINIVQNEADILIVYYDERCRFGAGTQSEITYGFMSGKAVYIVAAIDIPAWAKGCATEIFLSFEALREFLSEEYGKEEPVKVEEKIENKE
jgi:hypothetical protein